METRLTLRPGKDGTNKLLQRFGKRLVAVRYLYDAAAGRRYKTVELIIESQTWSPRPRRLRRTPDDIVAVRIHFHEAELRARAKALGGVWRPAQKIWELTWDAVRKLGIADRLAGTRVSKAGIRMEVDSASLYAGRWRHPSVDGCIYR